MALLSTSDTETTVPHQRLVILCLAAACLTSFQAAEAQIERNAKAPPEILERANAGVAQELSVALDASAAWERAHAKRRAGGQKEFDKATLDELDRDFEGLKQSVFPGGKLGENLVVESDKHVPIVVVRVPNARALQQLLRDPRVRSVAENHKKYHPSRRESLPLIGQPTVLASARPALSFPAGLRCFPACFGGGLLFGLRLLCRPRDHPSGS